jgi:hypothetical protein
MKYRKKPVVIDAVQWQGTKQSWDEIMAMGNVPWKPGTMGSESFIVKTIDGNYAKIEKGTWVCKGVAGEFYPCKPDIFERTYELAEDNEQTHGDDGQREVPGTVALGLTLKQTWMLNYLHLKWCESKEQWITPTEIGSKYGDWLHHGKAPRIYHSAAASKTLLKLTEKGLIERNERGHYRYCA